MRIDAKTSPCTLYSVTTIFVSYVRAEIYNYLYLYDIGFRFLFFTHVFGTREVGGFSDDVDDEHPYFHQTQESNHVSNLAPAL